MVEPIVNHAGRFYSRISLSRSLASNFGQRVFLQASVEDRIRNLIPVGS